MFRYIVLCFTVLLLLSCAPGTKDVIDQTTKLSRDDYKKALLPSSEPKKTTTKKKKYKSSLPDVAPILVAPSRPLAGKEKLVSLSVTEDVPLKDVLLELGRLADVDMELDPAIQGGIILKVKDQPLSEVVARISRLADLRYTMENGVMKVERDVPYLVTYPVDFLNIVRSNQGNISVTGGSVTSGSNSSSGSGSGSSSSSSSTGSSSGSGSGGSSSSSSGSGGVSSGSSNTITSQYDGDLWKSIESNINKILHNADTSTTASAALPNPGGVLSVSSPKGQEPAGNSNNTGGAFITINKQAGMINIFASKKQQEDISKYLSYVKGTTSSQVLIDAKIVEVTLDDEYHTGINWNTVDRNLGIGITGNFTQNVSTSGDSVALGVLNKTATNLSDPTSLEAMVQMTQMFGVARTLSSPRLHAMNNQQAVLSFAQNEVYFTVTVDTTDAQYSGGIEVQPPKTTVNSTLNTVPIGIVMTLQPSINEDTGEITMNIRPTLSRITGYVEDPAVTYLTASSTDSDLSDISSKVPVVEVRELDSVLKIKSGQIMVIGGLMEERAENNDSGVPFLSEIPWAGNLFKSVAKTTNVVQTVIFLKATIVPSNGGTGKADKEFYQKFTRDPDPYAF